MKKDPITRAVGRAQVATNLFAQAHAELDTSDDLLEQAIEFHRSEISRLEARLVEAQDQTDKNAKVKAKLAEFIA